MKMMGNAPVAPTGGLSVLEKALSKKMKPIKPASGMPRVQKPPKKG